jgi:hypothetical protein
MPKTKDKLLIFQFTLLNELLEKPKEAAAVVGKSDGN